MIPTGLVDMANTAFAKDAASTPSITWRGAEALDRYDDPPPFDPAIDEVADTYLAQDSGGQTFLDAASWRHYLPCLIAYAVRHRGQGNDVCDALLSNLLPPDREPPRLSSLSPSQEKAITAFLDFLGSPRALGPAIACLGSTPRTP